MTSRLARGALQLGLVTALAVAAPRAQALCVAGLCSCTVTTTNIAFGAYNPLAFGNTDSTGTVKVTCGGVAGLLVPFTIDLGKGGATSVAARRMVASGSSLNYNLYTDPSYTTVWGDGTGGSVSVAGSLLLDVLGLSPGQVFTVYGRIPGRQLTVRPGVYTDSISVTVTYQ